MALGQIGLEVRAVRAMRATSTWSRDGRVRVDRASGAVAYRQISSRATELACVDPLSLDDRKPSSNSSCRCSAYGVLSTNHHRALVMTARTASARVAKHASNAVSPPFPAAVDTGLREAFSPPVPVFVLELSDFRPWHYADCPPATLPAALSTGREHTSTGRPDLKLGIGNSVTASSLPFHIRTWCFTLADVPRVPPRCLPVAAVCSCACASKASSR